MNQCTLRLMHDWYVGTYTHVYLHRTLIVNSKHAWSSWFIKGCFMSYDITSFKETSDLRRFNRKSEELLFWIMLNGRCLGDDNDFVHVCDSLFYIVHQLLWNSLLQKRAQYVHCCKFFSWADCRDFLCKWSREKKASQKKGSCDLKFTFLKSKADGQDPILTKKWTSYMTQKKPVIATFITFF